MINELFGRLNKEGHGIEASPISPGQLGGLIDLVGSGEISGKIAKDVFEILWTEGGDPATIVAERGLRQVTDTGAIEAAVDEVVAANPDKVDAGAGEALARRLVRRPGDEGDRGQGQPAGGATPRCGRGSGSTDARPRLEGGTMTYYDYKVVPAPRRAKKVKGVHGAEELFALTLTEAINELARQGWEYVRAEHLPAEAPRGWFRARRLGRADRARLPPRPRVGRPPAGRRHPARARPRRAGRGRDAAPAFGAGRRRPAGPADAPRALAAARAAARRQRRALSAPACPAARAAGTALNRSGAARRRG